jgi:hypothetical protein|tara:strand:- start:299 stop:1006 length:708 start_codon:yes stop_codon:yes gene_type:complete
VETFLKQNYSLITHSVELLAVLIALLCYKKYKLTSGKYFIYFLFYVFVIDLLGEYPSFYNTFEWLTTVQNSVFRYNYWLFTIFYILGSIVFYMFYYHKILKNKTHKIIVLAVGILSLVISIIYIACNTAQFFNGFLPLISVLAAFSIITFTTCYFIELLQSDKMLRFYKILDFYISIALLFWWLITTPVIFYGIYNSDEDWNFVILKWQIFLFSNIMMYLTFTFGLLISRPHEND